MKKKDSKMTESLLFSTLDEDLHQKDADLGPWLYSAIKTIQQHQPRLNFSRKHWFQSRDKKEATAIKLPLIVNKTLIFNMAVDQSNMEWQPRYRIKIDEGQAATGRFSALVSRSMDNNNNLSPTLLKRISLRKKRNKKDSGFCVTGTPTTYLL